MVTLNLGQDISTMAGGPRLEPGPRVSEKLVTLGFRVYASIFQMEQGFIEVV